jgi:hypothetical protein
VGTAGVRLTQNENRERHVDEQHIFHRMVFFLAAITARLLSWILGRSVRHSVPSCPKGGKRVSALARADQPLTFIVVLPWMRGL